MWTAPTHLADLGSGQCPSLKAIKDGPHFMHSCAVHQVHESIAQVGITAEVHGKIHEIVETTEAALFVKQGQEHVTGVVVGQVAHHHRSPPVFAGNLTFCRCLPSLCLAVFELCGNLRLVPLTLVLYRHWRLLLLRLRCLFKIVAESAWLVHFWYIQDTCQTAVGHHAS
eukprot:Skav229785  [mRNA]  locus=scaffold684:79728:90165:+ [translate_table: standard]